jgi:predicted NUDIX family NTP pyrophosphohydrolase
MPAAYPLGVPATSAGLLLYRLRDGQPELLIAHIGGPFWARREERAWTIVKGEHGAEEEPLAAARREFAEETGSPPPQGPVIDLGEVRQSSGKRVRAFALAGEFDPETLRSNTFTAEWPPRSGRTAQFPEIDRIQWCDAATARRLLVAAQAQFVDRLLSRLAERP